VTAVFRPGERGRAIGIITTTVYAGLSLGPFIGGVLTHNVGWPAIFLVNIPLALIVIILTLMYIPEEWITTGERWFDFPGAILYGMMLFGGIYGLTLLPSIEGILWMTLGFAGFAMFVWQERRVKAPMVNLSLFTESTVFLFSNIAALINYAVVFAVGFLLSLQYNRGIDPQTTGLILIAQPVVKMIISPLAGHWSDRIDRGSSPPPAWDARPSASGS